MLPKMFPNAEHDHPSDVRDKPGARWEMRKEIWDLQSNTCFSNTDNTPRTLRGRSYFIPTVKTR